MRGGGDGREGEGQQRMRLTPFQVTVSNLGMQKGPFIKFIADALAEDEKTVAIYVRELLNAGLLTTGARGVNAPHMLPLDAARVVTALLATDRPSQAVEMVKRYGAMRAKADDASGYLAQLLADNPTLEQVMVRVIAFDPDETSDIPDIEVRRWDKSVVVTAAGSKAIFHDAKSAEDLKERRGKLVSCGMMPAGLLGLAADMWVDRFRGTDRSGLPLDLLHPWNSNLPEPDRRERYAYIKEFVRNRDVDWLKGA